MGGPPTLVDAVAAAVFRCRDASAVRAADGTVTTWAELGREVRHLALGLAAADVAPGERIALAGRPTASLLAAELAVHAARAISVVPPPGEPDPPADRIVDEDGLPDLRARGEAVDRERPDAFEALRSQVSAGDGVTSADGVTLTHRHLDGALEALAGLIGAEPGERVAALAPGHVLPARVAGWYLPLWVGGEVCLPDGNDGDAGAVVRATAPTIVVGDAAAWALVAGVVRDAAAGPLARRALRGARAAAAGEHPTVGERLQRAVLGASVEGRLRRDAGLARCRAGLVVGPPPAAPFVRDLHAVACPLLRVWGPASSAGLAAAGPLDPGAPDAVGQPMAGLAVAVEPDGDERLGEVVLRGDRLVNGTGDGWRPAGARGRLDRSGRLHVVGAGR